MLFSRPPLPALRPFVRRLWAVVEAQGRVLDGTGLRGAVERLRGAALPVTGKGEPNRNFVRAVEGLAACVGAGD